MAVEPLKYFVEKGHPTLVPIMSEYVDARVLAATTNEIVTVPSGAKIVVITPTVDIWVNFNDDTAAIPAADVTDGSASVLLSAGIPHARVLKGVSSFGVIASAIATLSLEWYA